MSKELKELKEERLRRIERVEIQFNKFTNGRSQLCMCRCNQGCVWHTVHTSS
jgi:hypothetical protein